MVEAVAIESFVTAVACLCASSYGPNVRPQSNLRENIASAITDWDRDVLQIFINSNRKFVFHDVSGNCELPDSDDFDSRLYELEYETTKQKQQSNKLLLELKTLRANCRNSQEKVVLATTDEEEVKALKAQLNDLRNKFEDIKTEVYAQIEENEKLKLQHESDQSELEKLRTEIKNLNAALQNATKKSIEKSKNGCLLTKKHGVSNIEVCIKQKVFCAKDLPQIYGNGWMLVAQRFDGSEHFYYNWINYAEGFGRHGADYEFFVGLDRIHTLTRSSIYELLIVLTDINNQTRYAHYDNFAISEATLGYELKSLGDYTGNAGDSLTYHLKQKFATFDKDQVSKCAQKHTGAWWYKEIDCHRSNLFGLYRTRRPKNDPHKLNGMIWSTFHNTDDGSLLSMRMYLRPREL